MRYRFGRLLASIILLGMVACSSPSPATMSPAASTTTPLAAMMATPPERPTAKETAAPYPPPHQPGVPIPTGYPGPVANTEAPLPTRTPVDTTGTPISGKGNVRGALLNRSVDGTSAPMPDYALLLARILLNTEGQLTGVASVDEVTAPSTAMDGEGRFVFVNVAPGTYALAIKHPLTLFLARDVASNQDVVFEVKAGEVTDLGTVTVSIAQ